MEHTFLDSLLKSTTAVKLSPQNANMVRLAPDRCHARARIRVWVSPDTQYLQPQCEWIFSTVCTNNPHWLHLAVSRWDHMHVFMMAFIAAPCKARSANQSWHSMSAPATKIEWKSSSMGQLDDSHGKTFPCKWPQEVCVVGLWQPYDSHVHNSLDRRIW